MRKHRRNDVYISFVILFLLFKIIAYDKPILLNSFNYKPAKGRTYCYKVPQSNFIIDYSQTNRKELILQNNIVLFTGIKTRITVLFLDLFICINIILDKLKKIKELNTIRFNGTKYKEVGLLPQA